MKGAEIVHASAKPDVICREICCPSMLLVVFVLIQSNDDVSTLFLSITPHVTLVMYVSDWSSSL